MRDYCRIEAQLSGEAEEQAKRTAKLSIRGELLSQRISARLPGSHELPEISPPSVCGSR